MLEENLSQGFRIKKNIDNTRNYFIEKTYQNGLMSEKHKKVWTTLHYIEFLLNLAYAITSCVSISAFASLVHIPIDIATSIIGLKFAQ